MTRLFSFQEERAEQVRAENEPAVAVTDFAAIFDRFRTPITRYIFHRIHNWEQANDLAQDTFLKAYKSLLNGTHIHEEALSAWLFRIATNTVNDLLRKKRRLAFYPLSMFFEERGFSFDLTSTVGWYGEDGTEHTHQVVRLIDDGNGGVFEKQIADREIIAQIFLRLPRHYAACLWLFEQEGLSCQQISKVLGISLSAVKMRLMRARSRAIALYRQETDGTGKSVKDRCSTCEYSENTVQHDNCL